MEKICLDVLNEWAKYSDYDRDRKVFDLMSREYAAHRVTENLGHITKTYDETGLLAVMSVKRLFNRIMDKTKISLLSVIQGTVELERHRKMYDLLNSEEITRAEERYLGSVCALIERAAGKNAIGGIDRENLRATVFDCTDSVIRALDKCRIEFYRTGGDFPPVTEFSTGINVFPSLAECVLTLSGAPDGMYTCFIDISHSSDSYFGFFVKSGTNLLSINERIDEAYKGQHGSARNGRWTEGKADDIFPYDYIFSYDGYDYKGYSHTYMIDKDRLSMSGMEDGALIPLLIAMILAAKKLRNIDPGDYMPVYIDSLLKANRQAEYSTNALAVIEKNEIVQHMDTLDLSFDYGSIMNGSALDEFSKDGSGYVCAANKGQIFVDLYGEGFRIGEVLSTRKMLSDGNMEYVPEFVGQERRMRGQAYCEIRRQLADYIRKKMYEEYVSYGGMQAVRKWFKEQVSANIDRFRREAAGFYMEYKEGRAENYINGWIPDRCEKRYFITVLEDVDYVSSIAYGPVYSANKQNIRRGRSLDIETGAACSIFFLFRPLDYIGLENLFGEIPKITKGWNRSRNHEYGNPNLQMTDAVEKINTPFEYGCSMSPEYNADRTFTNFAFSIGFSKRGLKKLLKEVQKEQAPARKTSGGEE